MAFIQMEFFSETLGLDSSVYVLIPQRLRRKAGHVSASYRQPYPLLYLLHGGSDNHASWMRNSAIERYAEQYGIAVVMPAVQYSFYSDQKFGFDYFTFLAEELPEIVRDFFPVSDRREDTFAAGISMGGYGAFKLGIRHPERFAAVASLSGSLDQRSRLGPDPGIGNRIMVEMAKLTFGSVEAYDRSPNDLAWVLERQIEAGVSLPAFYMACGTSDHNYTINEDFYSRFHNHVDIVYERAPNRGHDWVFWDEYIRRVLAWLPIGGRDA